MPIGPTDKTLLETHPHLVKYYLVVHQPETVLAARVNGALSGDPVTTITFDTVTSGAFGDVEAGQTLLVGSTSGGHERGIVRVRSATSTVLTIAESSDLLNVENNDYLTVLREHRFWLKTPRVVSLTEIYEDYDVAYTDEITAFGPIPMMGPCGFAFLDAATVDLEYDFSESVAIEGGSISSYATTYQQGDNGSSAASTFTETYSSATGMAGSETKLTVSDENQKTADAWRYDFILDRTGANAPITNWSINQPISAVVGGVDELTITLFGSAVQTILRDGARVWIICESWYGTTQQEISLEYPNRANILFEGWVVKDSIRKNSDHSTVSFVARPLIKMLSEGRAYPATLEINTSPTTWFHVTTLTIVKAVQYLIKHRSTLMEIADVHFPTSSTSISGQDWSTGSLRSQIDRVLKDDMMFLAQHKSGQFWVEKAVSLRSTSERSALDLSIIIEPKHWRAPLEIPEETQDRANYTFIEGVSVSSGEGIPYFSEAPGIAGKYRGQDGGRTDQLAIDDQDHINQLSGDILAQKNAKYPRIPVRLAGFWPVFDVVPQRRVRLDITAGSTNRGVNLSGTNFLVAGYRIRPFFAEGTAETELFLTEETDGLDGQTVTFPTVPPPPTDGRDPEGPPPYEPPTYPETDGGRRGLATDVGLAITDNIGANPPVYYLSNTGLSTDNDKYMYGLAKDPFHWGALDQVLWAGTRTGIWTLSPSLTGTWNLFYSYENLLGIFGYTDRPPNHAWKFRFSFSTAADGILAVACFLPTSEDPPFEDQNRGKGVFILFVPGKVETFWEISSDTGGPEGVAWMDVKVFQGTGIYYVAENQGGASTAFDHARLWTFDKTSAGWRKTRADPSTSITALAGGRNLYATLSIPPSPTSGSYIYWGSGDTWRVSPDGGDTWTDVPNHPTDSIKLGTSATEQRLFMPPERLDLAAVRWSNTGGAVWNSLPLPVLGGNNGLELVMSYTVWSGNTLQSVLVAGTPAGATPATDFLYYWEQGAADWVSKEGNLGALGVTKVFAVDTL